jgi:histidinol phosphate phosphatase hisJ family
MKRYAYEIHGNYSFDDYEEIIEKILKEVISRGIGLEINGSGYLNKVGEPYPSKKILNFYRNLGGEVMTVGSDSHFCENLARHNIKMINLLKEIGFKYIFTYEKRKKIPLKI